MDYGIKVMKEGYGVDDSDIRNIIMSSKYNMLKFHQESFAFINIPNGSKSGTTTINHNLGYVPAYIAYVYSSELGSKNYMLPYPGGVYTGIGYDIAIDSYATSTQIVLRVNASTNFGTYQQTASDCWDDFWGVNTFILTGKKDGNDRNGAFRFTNVDLTNSQSINSASIFYYVEFKGAGGGTWWIHSVGIDEDNTADFSANPMGRPNTDADLLSSHTLPPTGEYVEIYQTSIVSEIISRPGWNSGNALGFKLYNDGSGDEVWAEDDAPTSYLKIVKTGSVTFYFRVIVFKDRVDF